MTSRADADHPARSSKPGRWRVARRWLLAVHAVLVLPAVLVWLTAAAPALREGPDANIGAGVVGLYLLAFGLPWTLLLFLFDLNSLSTPVRDAVVAALPLLSLLAHAALVWRSERRHRVRPLVEGR